MSDPPKPLNRSAKVPAAAKYSEPAFGNPVSTLLESGVGNCFPGLEFDVRQLDVRFFPGLVFSFPGITPAGPDGTQGAVLYYMDTSNDPMLEGDADWVDGLNAAYAGDAGAALGDGTWYLHWIEQDGKRIELYDFGYYQNAVTPTPYEGETCWWIIRLIEPRKPLSIALTQRDENGIPSGAPVVLHGERRVYVNENGVFDPVYHPGELTASMCSPWTHDFRDCACQYWASNHPDVALGPVEKGFRLPNDSSEDDPAQAVTFLDWMRRRDLSSRDVSAAPTIGEARPRRYDPYEINLRWQELSFVLQGMEVSESLQGIEEEPPGKRYPTTAAVIQNITDELGPLEMTLALEYLYAYFSLRSPDELSAAETAAWPTLADDLRAARQLLLSVALSEMTHLRWVNQILWTLWQDGYYPEGEQYQPVIKPSRSVPAPLEKPGKGDRQRKPALRAATPETLSEFVFVEHPGQEIDTAYAGLVWHLRESGIDYPAGLYELAVRIDSDGMQHYQKFRDILRILNQYSSENPVYLRDITEAKPEEAVRALSAMKRVISAITDGYEAEARDDMAKARSAIMRARDVMHDLSAEAERLAGKKGLGVPFFAAFKEPPGA